jgi:hypothetical protein
MKQKLLVETLKTRQDVLVTQRMTAQEELDLLRHMCRDLQARNAELEARVKVRTVVAVAWAVLARVRTRSGSCMVKTLCRRSCAYKLGGNAGLLALSDAF